MAFLLSMTEIDKARAVGNRAISRIHFREEEEKAECVDSSPKSGCVDLLTVAVGS